MASLDVISFFVSENSVVAHGEGFVISLNRIEFERWLQDNNKLYFPVAYDEYETPTNYVHIAMYFAEVPEQIIKSHIRQYINRNDYAVANRFTAHVG